MEHSTEHSADPQPSDKRPRCPQCLSLYTQDPLHLELGEFFKTTREAYDETSALSPRERALVQLEWHSRWITQLMLIVQLAPDPITARKRVSVFVDRMDAAPTPGGYAFEALPVLQQAQLRGSSFPERSYFQFSDLPQDNQLSRNRVFPSYIERKSSHRSKDESATRGE